MNENSVAHDIAPPVVDLSPLFAGCRALILEDEIGEPIRDALLVAGFEAVDLVLTGEGALKAAAANRYDILILDRVNSGMEGLEVLDRVRKRPNGLATPPDVPTLVYSLLGGEAHRIHGLIERGADDYIPKPASDDELLARIAVQLRRTRPQAEEPDWSCAPLTVEPEAKVVTINGRKLSLTTRETDILIELWRERGNPLSQSMLWDRCWIDKGWSHFPEEYANTVDQAIKRLRKSLKNQCAEIPDPYHPLVVNIWAQGFALRNLIDLEQGAA